MPKNTNDKLWLDRVIWVVVMILAATAAFAMMKRDMRQKFGALSYGMFPHFFVQTVDGKPFNYHNLKGKVWLVSLGVGTDVDVVAQLNQLSEKTSSVGKRAYVLVFNDSSQIEPQGGPNPSENPYCYLVTGSAQDLASVKDALQLKSSSVVVLVDQNSAIRGVYDLAAPEQLLRLKSHILAVI